MARYIDVAKLLKDLTISPDGTKIPDVDCDNFPIKIDLRLLRRIILRQPTADVVEVVRCCECKHYRSYGRTSLLVDGKNIKAGWCQRRMRYDEEHRMLPDDFCSYGEKKRG